MSYTIELLIEENIELKKKLERKQNEVDDLLTELENIAIGNSPGRDDGRTHAIH